jgi:hypothetical protein
MYNHYFEELKSTRQQGVDRLFQKFSNKSTIKLCVTTMRQVMKRLSMLIAGPWLLLFPSCSQGVKPPWPVDGTPDVSTLPLQAGLHIAGRQ